MKVGPEGNTKNVNEDMMKRPTITRIVNKDVTKYLINIKHVNRTL